jgi:hypothetical protein
VAEKKDDPPTGNAPWHPVDPTIWAPGPPKTKIERATQRFLEGIRFLAIALIVTLGPIGVLLSFFAAYELVGVNLFGPVFLSIWAVAIVGFVVTMEKTGYARNFESSNFSLGRRILALPIAFLMMLGIILLLYVMSHPGLL